VGAGGGPVVGAGLALLTGAHHWPVAPRLGHGGRGNLTPEPYIFVKLDGKAVPTRGRSWMVRDACSSNMRRSTFFFKIV
jgi:hypothetical protein